MTERERFVAWATEKNFNMHILDGGEIYTSITTQLAWEGWKARAADEPTVPTFCNVAQRKLDQLLADGYHVSGYALAKEDKYCYADCYGLILWPRLESQRKDNNKGDIK
jgi:hypothetical protein